MTENKNAENQYEKTQAELEKKLVDANQNIKQLKNEIEQQKEDFKEKLKVEKEKIEESSRSMIEAAQAQQSARKKSDSLYPDPLSRSESTSPFQQRFPESASFVNRTSSRSSIFSYPGLDSSSYMEPQVDYDDIPSEASSHIIRESSSTGFDNQSISTIAAGPSIQMVNRMGRNIRTLESELASNKQDLVKVTKSRDEAVKDLSEFMKELETANSYKAKVEEMEKEMAQMKLREQTALEMLGEKSEQVEELRADVSDIKSMFQQQIEELVDRLAKAEKK